MPPSNIPSKDLFISTLMHSNGHSIYYHSFPFPFLFIFNFFPFTDGSRLPIPTSFRSTLFIFKHSTMDFIYFCYLAFPSFEPPPFDYLLASRIPFHLLLSPSALPSPSSAAHTRCYSRDPIDQLTLDGNLVCTQDINTLRTCDEDLNHLETFREA